MAANFGTSNINVIGTDEVESMDFQEEDLAKASSSLTDTQFDSIIGHVEDIIMEDRFQTMQRDFLEKHYKEFDDSEENKFIYTDIQTEYTNLIEKYLEDELSARLPGFNMQEFTTLLITQKNELDGEIFDILLTFSDFLTFKEMFLDYKAEKEGRSIDLSDGITVTPISSDIKSSGISLSLSGSSFTSQ